MLKLAASKYIRRTDGLTMHKLRTLTLALAWFGYSAWSCAQPNATADTTGMSSDYEQGAQLASQGRSKEALPLLEAARAKASTANLPLWQAKIDRRLGRMYCDKGRDSLGLALMGQSVAAYEAAGNTTEALRTEADMGWLEGRAGEQVQGIQRLRDTQARFLALGDSTGAAYCMGKEASLLINAGGHEKAIVLLRQAAGITERHNDPYLGWILCDLSHAQQNAGDSEASVLAAEGAIQVLSASDDRRGESYALVLRAIALNELGRHAEALADAQRSLVVFDRRYAAADAYEAQGNALLGLGRPKEALEMFNTARTSARESGNMAMYMIMEEPLSKALAATGDHKQAYEKLRHYYDFMKSCGMLDASNDIARMEMEHEFATKHLTDSLELAKREAIARSENELRLSKAHNTRNLFIAGGAIVLLIAIGLWLRLRYVRRSREAILKAQAQLVESEKRREAEEVRTRIARDMHDEIGSELTKIRLITARPGAQNGEAMATIAGLAAQAHGSMHDVVWAVDPTHDSARSLVTHAEQFAQRMLEGSTVAHELHFELEGEDRTLDPARKRNIFLLMKEALNNAIKYADARKIRVALEVTGNTFDMHVSDDGKGFDPQGHELGGNGLANMRARARALGAELEITSAPGGGCTVHASGRLA